MGEPLFTNEFLVNNIVQRVEALHNDIPGLDGLSASTVEAMLDEQVRVIASFVHLLRFQLLAEEEA